MSILTWIEDKKRQKVLNAPKNVASASDSSKGLWTRCDKCGVILYIKHLKENQRVCFGCSYHLQMMSQERIENLLDKVPLVYSLQSKTFSRKHTNVDSKNDASGQSPDRSLLRNDASNELPFAASQKSSKSGKANANTKLRENMVSTWRPLDETVSPCDPLRFFDQKNYTDRLKDAQERTGLQDAIQTGTGMIDGIPIALAVMDFSFMGGSMGSVVGEKITRLIEYATQEGLTLIIVSASGGARMQEGVFSLMQMAKISSALQIYQSCAKLLYISILTSPTTGGVTASFAMLGDIIFAEPKALIAFAGRRVIEQTLSEDLPEDFQTSEYMLHHGLVDLIVPRRFLRQALSESIRLYQNAPFKKVGQIPFGVQNPITFLTEEKVRRQLTKKRSVQLTKQGTKSIDFEKSILAELSVFSSKLGSSAPPIEKSKALDACCEPLVFDMHQGKLQLQIEDSPSVTQEALYLMQGQSDASPTVTRSMPDQPTHPYREILTSFRMMLNLFSPITHQYSNAELSSNEDISRKIGTNPESFVGASQNSKVLHVQGCEITQKISVFRPEKGLIPLPRLKKSNYALQLVYHQRLGKDFHTGKEYIRSLKSQLGYLLLQNNNKNAQKACHCSGTISIKEKEPNALNPFFKESVTTRKKIIKKGVLASQHIHKTHAQHLNGCKKITPFEFANRGFACTSKTSAYAQSVVQSSDNCKSVSRKPSASFCKKMMAAFTSGDAPFGGQEGGKKGIKSSCSPYPNNGTCSFTEGDATRAKKICTPCKSSCKCKTSCKGKSQAKQSEGLLKPFYRLSLQNTRQSTDVFKSRANNSYMLKRKPIGSNDNNHLALSFESFRDSNLFSFHPNIRLVSKKEQLQKKNSALVNRSTIGLQFLDSNNLIINFLHVNSKLLPDASERSPDALPPKVNLPLPSYKSERSSWKPPLRLQISDLYTEGEFSIYTGADRRYLLAHANTLFISQTLAKRLYAKRNSNAYLSSICKPSLKVINAGNLTRAHKKSKVDAPFINVSYKGNKISLLNRAIELAATESIEWRAFYIDKQVAEKLMRVSCKTICRSENLVNM